MALAPAPDSEATAGRRHWLHEARRNAGWLVAVGVVEVAVGILAIGAPIAASLAVTVLVGAAFLIAGLLRLVEALFSGSFGTGALAFLWGLVVAGTGLYLLAEPGLGMAALTLSVAVLFLVDGVARGLLAFRIRPARGWAWMLAGGLLSVLFGVMVALDFPTSGLWVLGTLVGISLVFNGITTVMIGAGARRVTGRVIDALS